MPRKNTSTKVDESSGAPPAAETNEPEQSPQEYELQRKEVLARLQIAIQEKGGEPKSLVGKLALITGLVGQIKKTGENKFHGYRYAKEGDLVEAIRPMLAALGIWIHWTLYSDPEKMIVHHERLAQTKKDGTESESLTVVTALYKFVDEDGNSTEAQMMMGYGDDTGDKGLYKALTGMEKYFLMKTFMVSTGDDPEADDRTDRRAAARDAQTSVTVQRAPRGQQPAAHGGRQAAASRPQVRQLGEQLRLMGITTTIGAIQKLEQLTGETVEIPDQEDLPSALEAFLEKLPGEKMGKALHDLRAEERKSVETVDASLANGASQSTVGDDEPVASQPAGEPTEGDDDALGDDALGGEADAVDGAAVEHLAD